MMTEYEIQTKLVRYIRLKYPDLLMAVSPAAGFKVSRGVAMKMIAMGYQKGTPDIIILEPRGGYHGLCIELKAEKGVVSDEQKMYLQKLALKRYSIATAFSLETAMQIVNHYLDVEM